MESHTFPISKNGHEYTITDDALTYRGPAGARAELPFTAALKLKSSPWSGALSLRGRGGAVPLAPLDAPEQRALLLELFSRWRTRDPEAAKKAAFDYTEGQRQFLPIAFLSCLLVGLPVGVALVNDAREQYVCTRVLREGSTVAAMEVTKFRKKRKGHYTLSLAYTTPQGVKIEGTDQLIMGNEGVEEEMENHIPKSLPFVYSPARPECWSLTPEGRGLEADWAKRRYFTVVAGLFGLFFLVVCAYGFAWSGASWRHRRRPFREELTQMFDLK